MKLFSILATAACVFGALVAASPVALPEPVDNSLAVRTEEAGVAIIDLLVKLEVDIDLCNKKWENTCKQKKCGESDIKDYDLELSLIIKACVEKLKVIIGAGLVLSELHISVIVDLCVKIFLSINLYLNILFKLCGFLPTLFVALVLKLCVNIKLYLNLLIAVLSLCINGLVVKITILLGVGLSTGLVCLVCSLLGLVL